MGNPVPAGWSESTEGLKKTFTFESFKEAMAFVVETGRLAEKADHHPDIDIRWNKVSLTLITHSAGNKVTKNDYALAAQANEISLSVIKSESSKLFS